MNKVSKFLLDVFVILSVFWLGCYVIGFAMRHPIFLLLAGCIEALVFLSWEIESRKNRKNYCKKGEDDNENA